jgi:uncharacterized protein YbjT (DUF2867 family)
MKIFLTGATGFVGSSVAKAIVDAGHDLHVLERTAGASKNANIRFHGAVQGDVTDLKSIHRGVRGSDVVVHLVGIRQGKPEQFERVVVEGTRNLLTAAKEAGVRRFILMSALGVTEQTKDSVPYYKTKWISEQDTKASAPEYVIFRPSFIFGRGGGILPTFRMLAKLGPVTGIVGSGKQRIQPIWVDDVGAYFAAAIAKPEAANRTFELGGPDIVDWNEFWRRLRSVLGIRLRPVIHVPTALMRIPAMITERLPGNIPLTRDLLTMLEAGDNVATNDDAARTFRLPLIPLDEQLRHAV